MGHRFSESSHYRSRIISEIEGIKRDPGYLICKWSTAKKIAGIGIFSRPLSFKNAAAAVKAFPQDGLHNVVFCPYNFSF